LSTMEIESKIAIERLTEFKKTKLLEKNDVVGVAI